MVDTRKPFSNLVRQQFLPLLMMTIVVSKPGGSAATSSVSLPMDQTQCPQEFSVPLFRRFFDEQCLSEMPLDLAIGCPLQAVEDYMKALLGELQIFSLVLSPITFYCFFIVTSTAKCPMPKGAMGWSAFILWVTLQVLSVLIYTISLIMYVVSYIGCHWRFHKCFMKLGDAEMLHLVVPAMSFLLMPAVNKICPLWLVLYSTLSAATGFSLLFSRQEHPLCWWLIVGLFGTCISVSLLYSVFTLGVVFSVLFVPVTLLQCLAVIAGCIGAPFVLTGCLEVCGFAPEKVLGTNPVLFWAQIVTDAVESKNDEESANAVDENTYFLLLLPLAYIIVAPLVVLGIICAFATYRAEADSITLMYNFLFDPKMFILPSFIDLTGFFQDPLLFMETIEDTIAGHDMPPARLLKAGALLSVMATAIASFKTAISIGNVVLQVAGWAGFETKEVLLSAEQIEEIDEAVHDGDLDTLTKFIEMNVSFRRTSAPFSESLEMVKFLHTRAKVNFNVKGVGGQTPAHKACSNGDLELATYLHQEAKADFNVKDNDGRTPAHCACDVDGDYHQRDLLEYLHRVVKIDLNVKDVAGQTPAHIACCRGHFDLVKFYEEEDKACLNVRDNHGKTLAHFACSGGNLELVKYLHDKVKTDFNVKDAGGETPAHTACRSGHLHLVRFLHQEVKADFNVATNKGETPAHLASCTLFLELVKYLHEQVKADFNVKDVDGKTPAHRACARLNNPLLHWGLDGARALNVLRFLHESVKVDFTVMDKQGKTPVASISSEAARNRVRTELKF